MKEQPTFDLRSIGGTLESVDGGYRFMIPADLVEDTERYPQPHFTDNVIYDSEWLATQAAFSQMKG